MLTGVEDELVQILGMYSPIPTTYAGGVRDLLDVEKVCINCIVCIDSHPITTHRVAGEEVRARTSRCIHWKCFRYIWWCFAVQYDGRMAYDAEKRTVGYSVSRCIQMHNLDERPP